MSPSCLGEPGLSGSPASVLISSSSAPCFCANSPDSRESTWRSMEMPRRSMRASTAGIGALQRLVDGGDVLGRQPRLQRGPQPQRHVGVLGGIFGGLVDGDAVEGDLRFARAGDVLEVDGVVVEPALGEIVHAVAALAGVQHVGDQHGVVVAGDLDAALREHQPVVFQILPDLEDASVLEQRLERLSARLLP